MVDYFSLGSELDWAFTQRSANWTDSLNWPDIGKGSAIAFQERGMSMTRRTDRFAGGRER
jgi:hypothetical protein